jgi:hypothetical protein
MEDLGLPPSGGPTDQLTSQSRITLHQEPASSIDRPWSHLEPPRSGPSANDQSSPASSTFDSSCLPSGMDYCTVFWDHDSPTNTTSSHPISSHLIFLIGPFRLFSFVLYFNSATLPLPKVLSLGPHFSLPTGIARNWNCSSASSYAFCF